MNVQDDQLIFESRDVLVSSSRVVVKGHTYAVRNITSVSVDHSEQDNSGVIGKCLVFSLGVFLIVGIALGVLSNQTGIGEMVAGTLFGALCSAVGSSVYVAVWRRSKRSHLVIATSAGETRVMSHRDASVVDMLVRHVQTAIASPQ